MLKPNRKKKKSQISLRLNQQNKGDRKPEDLMGEMA